MVGVARLGLTVAVAVATGGSLAAMSPDEVPAAESYGLPASIVLTVRSAARESYRVMVAWPESDPPAAGWPVLYVLDGEDNFAIAALTARRLARAGGRGGVGAGVIVGIEAGPLARRVRDYTPTTPGWTIPEGRPASGLVTGGGDAFLDVLDEQVRSLVRARWRVDPARETLVGHSFGGLLALHAAFTRPASFDGIVAVSPSLWFGNGLIAREATADAAFPRILVAEGERQMQTGTEADASPTRLVQVLASRGERTKATFLLLPGQSHGTTMLAAMAPAIEMAFGIPAR